MTPAPEYLPKVAVVGAGAVGGYFGGMLARAGVPIVFIGRPAFVEAVNKTGLVLDTASFREVIRVDASTELRAVRGAELVLFCVKSGDSEPVARELVSFVAPGAVVVSMQNGVDNVDRIHASGLAARAAVVYVAASTPESGTVKHVGGGNLVLGPPDAETDRIAPLFERAGVPCRISDNIRGELWAKLVANGALNAISALGRARYGQIAESSEALVLVRAVVDEIFAVARAAAIVMPGMADTEAAFAGVLAIATHVGSSARSSTAQDVERGRRTEIDALNGYVARRAAELGVPAPLNHALWALVKLIEAGRPR